MALWLQQVMITMLRLMNMVKLIQQAIIDENDSMCCDNESISHLDSLMKLGCNFTFAKINMRKTRLGLGKKIANFGNFNVGFIRQPKWGHLRELHKAIKLCEEYLISSDPIHQKLGANLEVNDPSFCTIKISPHLFLRGTHLC